MAKLDVIRNPFLNDLMYDLCYNMPDDTKKKLSVYYRKILASPIRTKNFCEFSNMDTKLKFFHDIGMQNAITIFPDKAKNGVALYDLMKKYETDRLASATKDHSAMSVFVTTDKETSFFLGLMAQTIHSSSYVLNLDYNKVGYHFRKWGTKLDTDDHKELTECVESAGLIAQTMLETSLCLNNSKVLFNVNPSDVQLLFYMYKHRHLYLKIERIHDVFIGMLPKRLITSSFKRMFLNGYVRKHSDYKILQYTITGLGIDLVNQFIQRVLKNNNF